MKYNPGPHHVVMALDVALLRGGAWIEITTMKKLSTTFKRSHSFAGVRGLKSFCPYPFDNYIMSHSFAGVRGLK